MPSINEVFPVCGQVMTPTLELAKSEEETTIVADTIVEEMTIKPHVESSSVEVGDGGEPGESSGLDDLALPLPVVGSQLPPTNDCK